MGRQFILVNESAPGVVFYRFRWIWDAAFWFFVTFVPSRRFMQWYVWRTGARGLLQLIAETKPDVIVSVYPVTTEVLGHLRRSGQIHVPVCAAITDLAMMHYWAAPGIDLHLITHPETEAEVRSIAGAGDRGASRPRVDSTRVHRAVRLGQPRGVFSASRRTGRSCSSQVAVGAWATLRTRSRSPSPSTS